MNVQPARFSPSRTVAKTFGLIAAGVALFAGARAARASDGLERQVLAQINLARTRPAEYADGLAAQRGHYQGNFLLVPGERPIHTREGVAALDEAIRALRHARPLPPLAASEGLARAAADLAREQAHTGATGHHGADGSNPFRRMNRHGRWQDHAGEAVDYGGATARRIVMNLLVDDGVRDRGHRLNLLAPDFAVAGVSCAAHPRYRRVCVIDFAVGFAEASTSGGAMALEDGARWVRRPAAVLAPAPLTGWRR